MTGRADSLTPLLWRKACSLLAVGLLLLGPGGGSLLWAGGALAVVGPASPAFEGTAYIFDISGGPIPYHVDGGPMASGGTVDILNPAGITRVDAMFGKWIDVQTSALDFVNVGGITPSGAFGGGDVSTVAEYQAVAGDTGTCAQGLENMVIFDADGSLFTALGFPAGIIGFAGPCAINPGTGKILTAKGVLNGKFQNDGGVEGPSELSPEGFDGAFIHEFGHMFGMDHSQVNLNCFLAGCAETDDAFGLPSMFPFLTTATEGGVAAIFTLAEDDMAWVSKFYPETGIAPGEVPFTSAYGAIEGTIRFSDGETHAQGVNVIARQVDDPATAGVLENRRIALSGVSGLFFSLSPGQTVTGTNTGGDPFFGGQADPSRTGFYSIPVPPGEYTIEVETIFAAFTGGSGINPFADAQTPLPGGIPEFYSGGLESDTDDPRTNPNDTVTVTVAAGAARTGIDIILNGTIARFDAFESAGILPGPELAPPQPLWAREDDSELAVAGEAA